MAASAILAIKIIADASQASKGLDKASSRAGKFGNAVQKAAAPAAAVAGVLLGLGKVAVKAASDQEQAFGATETVFGKYASTVIAKSKTAASSVGLSATAYSELANVIGSQLKAVGVPMDKVAGQTDDLVKKGADLAATFGGSTADAVSALSGVLKGETDPIERYGISVKQAGIEAEALSMGLVKTAKDTTKITAAQLRGEVAARNYAKAVKEHGKNSTEALSARGAVLSSEVALEKAMKGTKVQLTAQQKAQAALSLVNKQSADTTDQFAKQTDSLAEKQQIAKAHLDDTAATLGAVLLPVVGAVTDALGDMAKWAGENAKVVQILAAVIGGLAAAILVISGVMKAYAVVQGIVNAVMAANPAVIVALAIVALIVVIVLLVKNWKTVARVAAVVWKQISAAARAAGAIVGAIWRAVFGKVTAAARAVGRAVSAVFRGVGSAVRAVGNGVKSGWSTAMGAARRATSSAGSAIRSGWRTTGSAMRTAGSAVRTGWSNAMSGVRSAGSKTASALRAGFAKLPGPVQAIARALSGALIRSLEAVGRVGMAAFNVILHPVQSVQNAISSVIGAVQSLIGWLSRIKVPSIKIPFTGGGKSAPSSAPAVAGVGVTRSARGGVSGRSSTPTGAGGDTFVVNAPLGDGDQIARSLDLILARRARRTGGVRRIGTRLPLVSGT